jgi:hypothetical protein
MKTWMVLVLMLTVLVTASAVAFSAVTVADVTSAVAHVRTAEPARLLVCGATLLVLSVALRRATFVMHKR